MLTKKDKELLEGTIDAEGFDYAFVSYSSFEEIKDQKFHLLRLAYVAAQKALEDYMDLNL